MAETAPVHAANVVFTAASAATSPRLALLIMAAEPGLKPYHPNHRANVPRNCWRVGKMEANQMVVKVKSQRFGAMNSKGFFTSYLQGNTVRRKIIRRL
jgi:hypothetical protein